MRKKWKWIAAILAIFVLRSGIGPTLVGVQVATGAFEPGGNCYNYQWLMSYGLGDKLRQLMLRQEPFLMVCAHNASQLSRWLNRFLF